MWVFLIHFHLLISLLNISAGFEPWDEWTPENCKNSWTCQFSADFQHWSRSMMCIFPGELKLPWFLWFKDFNLCILVSTCFKWITLLPHVGFFSWRFCFFFKRFCVALAHDFFRPNSKCWKRNCATLRSAAWGNLGILRTKFGEEVRSSLQDFFVQNVAKSIMMLDDEMIW